MRRTIGIVVALAAAGAVAVTAVASRHTPSTTGTVTGVPSGDTLVVRLPAKGKTKARSVRVKILGVSAPAGPSCFAAQSVAKTKALALGKKVALAGYLTQRVYVTLPGSVDLGSTLVQSGTAQVDTWSAPFSRLQEYVPLQQAAETAGTGMWGACAADLNVTASGPQRGAPGDYLTYTGSVTNQGPETAKSVLVELRPGSYAKLITAASSTLGQCTSKGWVAYCTIDSMAAGSSATLTLTIRAATPGALSARFTATLVGCDDQQCGSFALDDPQLLNDRAGQLTIVPGGAYGQPGHECDAAYPTICIPPPPPDLDCADLAPVRAFPVNRNAPEGDDHHLDGNGDGIACEGDDY